jgi:hypothetical protein
MDIGAPDPELAECLYFHCGPPWPEIDPDFPFDLSSISFDQANAR